MTCPQRILRAAGRKVRRFLEDKAPKSFLRAALCALAGLCLAGLTTALADAEATPQRVRASQPLEWHSDYAQATEDASRQAKMLLIYFRSGGEHAACRQFESAALADPNIVDRLRGYVLLRLDCGAVVKTEGGSVCLLKHESFSEMLGSPGLAIIDYAHRGAPYHGSIVSQFPMSPGRAYTPIETAVILDLPPGTLTQRTLVYAVRTHPERPASSDGTLDENLAREAQSHSTYQADICRQGHHFWEHRFHRINAMLPAGMMAREVCAESWPGQRLLESAIECVRCWRTSSGHWSAVAAPHRFYGYDMKRGPNGTWYATGIFSGH